MQRNNAIKIHNMTQKLTNLERKLALKIIFTSPKNFRYGYLILKISVWMRWNAKLSLSTTVSERKLQAHVNRNSQILDRQFFKNLWYCLLQRSNNVPIDKFTDMSISLWVLSNAFWMSTKAVINLRDSVIKEDYFLSIKPSV